LLDLEGNNLVTIAVLKSVQINQTINFLYNEVFAITTRVLIQAALINYYANKTDPEALFAGAFNDLQTAMGTQPQIMEARIYTIDFTPLPNLTFSEVSYSFPNSLFPTSVPPPGPGGNQLTSGEILGPVAVPDAPGLYVLSMTIPITNVNSSSTPLILGYMSMVLTASGLQRAVNDSTGMGQTGQLLVVAKNGSHYDIVLPPGRTPTIYNENFYPGSYPAVDDAFKNRTGFLIDTHNVAGAPVSVGYNVKNKLLSTILILQYPSLRFVQWAILAEQLRSEVYGPIVEQQKLSAITSVVPYTAVCLIISLLVIIFVKSITDLSRANKVTLRAAEIGEDNSSRILPDPVKERTWWFRDEISDVQRSHNIMRDQLLRQYESLEDQVRIKTAELHGKMEELEVALSRVEEEKLNTQNALQVKEDALATQERLMHSVAHDLKTPLNGILAPIESCMILLITR
jgi:osomolarity two-component system, sensor histidine kinase SLN1